jgi:hypothetical protein
MDIPVKFTEIGHALRLANSNSKEFYKALSLMDSSKIHEINGVLRGGNSSKRIDELGKAIKGLSQKQQLAILSSQNLTKAQIGQALASAELKKEQISQALATGAVDAANKGATSSTFNFGVAVKGLGVAIASNPIGIIVTALTAFITISQWVKQSQEEARQATQDSAKALDEQAKSLETTKERVGELRKELDSGSLSQSEAYDKRSELYQIQKDLIEQYGNEAKSINLVTGEIKAQKEAIDRLSDAKLSQTISESASAIAQMKDIFEKTQLRFFTLDTKTSDHLRKELTKMAQGLGENAGVDPAGSYSFGFQGTYAENAAYLGKLLDNFRQQFEDWDITGSVSNKIFTELSEAYRKANKVVESHRDTYKKYIEDQIRNQGEYNAEYGAILAARANLEKAYLSGTEEEVSTAQQIGRAHV